LQAKKESDMSSPQQTFEDFKRGRMQSFYGSTYGLLIGYAQRFLGEENAYLAEDCVQDAIFNAYQNRDKMTNIVQLKSYVYASVHNNAITYVRKRMHGETYAKSVPLTDSSLSATIAIQDAMELLYTVVKELPDNMQQLFRLHIEEGLKLREVAERLNMSDSGVKKQKARMIRLLRQKFGENETMLLLVLFMV